MLSRSAYIIFLLVLLLGLSVTPGCISLRTADTHNTTVAVQSYNTWVSGQNVFDQDVRSAVEKIGGHVDTYNREIARDEPDYSLLRQNLAADRQLLDRWGSGLDNLSASTSRFEESTGRLTYDNASKARVIENLGAMTQYMKVYAVEMGNSRQHLIEYVNNAESYIGPEDPDYWNEKYRLAAMQAKNQGLTAVTEGDSALENLTTQAKKLEELQ